MLSFLKALRISVSTRALTLGLSLALALVSSTTYAQVVAAFKLSPVGSFKAETSDVKGSAKMVGNKVSAENIVVNLKSLKTGVGLRDEHLLKRLEVNKFPEAVLLSASGENGKGTGKVKIRGFEKPIEGTYKVVGNKLEANFKMLLSDYKIEGVNYVAVKVKDEFEVTVTLPLEKK